jgi:hypothetical protein
MINALGAMGLPGVRPSKDIRARIKSTLDGIDEISQCQHMSWFPHVRTFAQQKVFDWPSFFASFFHGVVFPAESFARGVQNPPKKKQAQKIASK